MRPRRAESVSASDEARRLAEDLAALPGPCPDRDQWPVWTDDDWDRWEAYVLAVVGQAGRDDPEWWTNTVRELERTPASERDDAFHEAWTAWRETQPRDNLRDG